MFGCLFGLFGLHQSLDLVGQVVLDDVVVDRLGNHIAPVHAIHDLLADLGGAHGLFPLVKENVGTVAQLAQTVKLLVAPVVVDGEEGGGGEGNVVVQDLGALNGIRNNLKVFSLNTCF